MTRRVTLPNGDWADLTERLNYAQARRLNAARGTPDAAGTVVAALVVNWALRDVDDAPIEFPGADVDGVQLDALDRIPYETFQMIAAEAVDILPSQPDPKDTAGQSLDSQQGSDSVSPPTLPTPISSQTIPAGPGRTYKPHLPT